MPMMAVFFVANTQTLMNQRDRVQLMVYQSRLKPDSQEWFYARKVLQDSVRISLSDNMQHSNSIT